MSFNTTVISVQSTTGAVFPLLIADTTLDTKLEIIYADRSLGIVKFFLDMQDFSISSLVNLSQLQIYGLKKELNVLTYPIYLFIFPRFECTTLIIKELLLNLFIFHFY